MPVQALERRLLQAIAATTVATGAFQAGQKLGASAAVLSACVAA